MCNVRTQWLIQYNLIASKIERHESIAAHVRLRASRDQQTFLCVESSWFTCNGALEKKFERCRTEFVMKVLRRFAKCLGNACVNPALINAPQNVALFNPGLKFAMTTDEGFVKSPRDRGSGMPTAMVQKCRWRRGSSKENSLEESTFKMFQLKGRFRY
jgi:hypothetical protein